MQKVSVACGAQMLYIIVDFSRNIGTMLYSNGNCSKYMMLETAESLSKIRSGDAR